MLRMAHILSRIGAVLASSGALRLNAIGVLELLSAVAPRNAPPRGPTAPRTTVFPGMGRSAGKSAIIGSPQKKRRVSDRQNPKEVYDRNQTPPKLRADRTALNA